MSRTGGGRPIGITLIAALKLAQSAALGALGFGVRHLAMPGVLDDFAAWVTHYSLASDQRLVAGTLEWMASIGPRQLRHLGAAALLYAGLLAIEGVGLFAQRRWAEYMTVIITASFVPFELFEVIRHVTIGRTLTFVVNVLVVAYLVRFLRRNGQAHAHPRP